MNPYIYPGLEIKHKYTDLLKDMTEYVAASHGTTYENMLSSSRQTKNKDSRFICMYMLKKCTDLTYTYIGEYYNRDHSTVIHAVKKIEEERTLPDRHAYELNNYIKELQNKFKINPILTLR